MKPYNEQLPLIDEAIDKLGGEWPEHDNLEQWLYNFTYGRYVTGFSGEGKNPHPICNRQEFEQRVKGRNSMKEYEYMKEYPCNGEKPDLPDDVLVWYYNPASMFNSKGVVASLNWSHISKFKVIDERYKPKSDWFERGELPPVGEVVEFVSCEPNYFYEPISERWKDGDELEVLAHKGGETAPVAVVWNKRDRYATCLVSKAMRPLRAEEDELLAQAEHAIESVTGEPANSSHLSILIKAGLLRKP